MFKYNEVKSGGSNNIIIEKDLTDIKIFEIVNKNSEIECFSLFFLM